MGKIVTLAYITDGYEAIMIKNYLEANGINCISNDNITNSNFGLGGSIAFPVELQINEDDFERAKEVMKEGGYAKYLQEEE